MRRSLSEAETAMIVQTVSADRATMLASLVRIFRRLSRLIFDLPGEKRLHRKYQVLFYQ
jgi:hypothetical protein